jgi:hypothetical protein
MNHSLTRMQKSERPDNHVDGDGIQDTQRLALLREAAPC